MLVFQNVLKNILCMKGHPEDILEEMRRVRILFGIAVSVVHTVQDSIGTRI